MIVACDYKAVEWMVALELSRDKVGVREWMEGADMHSINQEKFKLPERRIAKIFLFRLIYGGTEWSYAKDPDYNWISDSPKFWRDMIEKFYDKYSGLHRWHGQLVSTVTRTGKLVIPTGREYLYSPERKRGEMVWPRTTILNYPVQGFAAELVKIGRVLLMTRLAVEAPRSLLISTVHDSLVVDAHPDEALTVAKMMWEIVHKQTFEAFNKLFTYQLTLPIRGDISFGPNQSDLEEWKP
jgi:DNA polymerase I-like protein with 3'-5' exonuclease and polymerase domains